MKQETKTQSNRQALLAMTAEQFAQFGEGVLAYVRPMKSEEVNKLFPQAPEMRPGMQLFALLAADGSPILLADSREAVIANAWENELAMVSVH